MKVIFLDIDGVINSAYHWVPFNERKGKINSSLWDIDDLVPLFIHRLNEIIEATEAKVVISSTWRKHYSPAQMEDMLTKQGFKGEVVGETPEFSRTPDGVPLDRGDEIKAWLDSRDIEQFVILDDVDFDNIVAFYPCNFVHVKKSTGLLSKHVEHAIRILHSDAS